MIVLTFTYCLHVQFINTFILVPKTFINIGFNFNLLKDYSNRMKWLFKSTQLLSL